MLLARLSIPIPDVAALAQHLSLSYPALLHPASILLPFVRWNRHRHQSADLRLLDKMSLAVFCRYGKRIQNDEQATYHGDGKYK